MDGRAVALAIPFFLLLIGLEVGIDRARRRRGLESVYRFADSITSLACGVGQQMLQTLVVGALGIGIYTLLYETAHVVRWPGGALGWALAFVLVDLGYWTYHWASHRVNFFWAKHVVHHQSEEYNLTTALRQSWFTGLTSWMFYTPLAVLGVPPATFVLCTTLNTLYQFWIHTRLVKSLGPLEWVLNTPAHHRVHHGIDPQYIDKNYAGVFIVWDRLFGTFAQETIEPAYGTVKPLSSFNAFWANVEGYVRLWEMSRRTTRLVDKLRVWVAPPEWQPDDLGGVVTVPEVDHATRVKFDVRPSRALFVYVGAQFGLVAAQVGLMLWYAKTLAVPEKAALVVAAMLTLATWSALLERRSWGVPVELGRLALLGGALGLALRDTAWLLPALGAWAVLAVASGLAVLRAVRLDRERAGARAAAG